MCSPPATYVECAYVVNSLRKGIITIQMAGTPFFARYRKGTNTYTIEQLRVCDVEQ